MQNAGFGTQQKKTALLCIDMQNDFVLPGAVLCVKEGINCVPFVINAVEVAHSSGIPVVWVIREHHRSGGFGFLVSAVN